MSEKKFLSPILTCLAAGLLTLLLVAPVSAQESNLSADVEPQPTTEEKLSDEMKELIERVRVEVVLADAETQETTSFAQTPATRGATKSVPYPVGGTGAPAQLIRISPQAYDDGISSLAGATRPSPRVISNLVVDQPGPVFSQNRISDMMWQWGQFVDHDVDLTEPNDPAEPAPIPVPLGDPDFDPYFTGTQVIPLDRSIFDPSTGTSTSNPRQQVNEISGPIDGTNVYGQDPARTLALRENDGSGRLKTSPGDFMPYNTFGLPNAIPNGANPTDFFLAGDIRSNEQIALTAMHTLWVREHNTIADFVRKTNRSMTGNQVFETARRTVVAQMQVITYQEFLPHLLGASNISAYTGYDPSVNPGIATEFSTALFRLGHTMLSPTIQRLEADGTPIMEGPIALRDAFNAPDVLVNEGGIDPILKGLSSQIMQRIDNMVIDDLRNFLFGFPGAGGLDLASLNIQRGRDHGLPDYNTVRIHYGLPPVTSFADISSDTTVQNRLASAYTSVNDIDAWVGAIAEDPVAPDVLVGELLLAGLKDQFERLRDGDPNWYQNILSNSAQQLAENRSLSEVIIRNTTLRRSDIQMDVFVVP